MCYTLVRMEIFQQFLRKEIFVMKKFLALLLSAVPFVSLFAFTVSAESTNVALGKKYTAM